MSNSKKKLTNPAEIAAKEMMAKSTFRITYIKSMEEKGFYVVTQKSEIQNLIVGTKVKVPIHFIRPNLNQPRFIFKEEDLKKLKKSITVKNDVNEPLKVYIKKDHVTGEHFLELIGGERRWRSCKMANLMAVSCIIKDPPSSEKELFTESVIDNFGKKDLEPIEEAFAVQRMENYGYSIKEIAERLTRTEQTIMQIKSRLNLTPQYQKELADGKLNRGEAILISGWGKDDQSKIYEIIKKIKEEHKTIHINDLYLKTRIEAEKSGLKKDTARSKRGRKDETTSNLIIGKIIRASENFRTILKLAENLKEKDFEVPGVNIVDIIRALEDTKNETGELLNKINSWD